MKCIESIKGWFRKESQRAVFDRSLSANPLREFVYLDEVSLCSLLSSKKGEMTTTTSRQESKSVENESRDTLSIGHSNVGKIEGTSRFQTRNSSTLQTAKKATVQSWFRELDKLKGIRLLETVQQVEPFKNVEEFQKCLNPSVCIKDENLKRGELVEFRVRLSTDPIFHIVTLMSEFKGMAKDFPEMMGGHGELEQLADVEGISLVLQRLLAGLIPVRAKVLDYAVVNMEGEEHIVHIDAITDLEVDAKPFEIVCVTELDAYWKDIRRVLFSDAEFTMLARISKSGLQTVWTPIKLADLMKGLVPDLSQQLNSATSLLFNSERAMVPQTDNAATLRKALTIYSEYLFNEVSEKISIDDKSFVNTQIAELEISEQTASLQKAAFVKVNNLFSKFTELEITSQQDVEFREQARSASGLSHFRSLQVETQAVLESPSENEQEDKHLLDVEVIAMYW